MPAAADAERCFWRVSTAGILFQGGAAAVDTSTVVASLVGGLTGNSAFAVGAAAALARFGWLFPQLFVAYHAQRHARRLPFYVAGAFGRVACLIGLAGLLWLAPAPTGTSTVVLFFALWTVYAFVSGLVAVPYNDIVGRSIPSDRRSRMLALRFFGGGLLTLTVALAAHRVLAALPFPLGHATLLLLGAALLLASAVSFVSAGEPRASPPPSAALSFRGFLRQGASTLRRDHRFRLFVVAQWFGSAAALALPFYVLLAARPTQDVALLLGAQTVGALLSNPLWGWWGDRLGKRSLLEGAAALGMLAPLLALAWIAGVGRQEEVGALPYFAAVFALLGAAGNGGTIAMLGYLMEISPDERRPAYSGYFNALVAPAALLPMAGGAVAQAGSLATVFMVSLVAAALQFLAVRRLRAVPDGDDE